MTTSSLTPSSPELKSKAIKALNAIHKTRPISPIHPVITPQGYTLYTTNPSVFPLDGLYYIPNFLTKPECEKLVHLVDSNPFCTALHRRQQFYGQVYFHTSHDLTALQPKNSDLDIKKKDFSNNNTNENVIPLHENYNWLFESMFDPTNTSRNLHPDIHSLFQSFVSTETLTSGYPTQVLVNEYLGPKMGVASHFEDTDSFGEYIITLSLINPIYLTLKKPRIKTNVCQDIIAETKILLEPGSCLVLCREARYDWRHGITKARIIDLPLEYDLRNGCSESGWEDVTDVRDEDDDNDEGCEFTGPKVISIRRKEEYRRISLTIRKLLSGRKRVEEDSKEWVDVERFKVYS